MLKNSYKQRIFLIKNMKKLMAFAVIAVYAAGIQPAGRLMPKIAGLLAGASALAIGQSFATSEKKPSPAEPTSSPAKPVYRVTLYRACVKGAQENSCKKASADYIARLKNLSADPTFLELITGTVYLGGVKPFENPDSVVKDFVDSERDKYNFQTHAGFQVRDLKTGEVVATRHLSRHNVPSVIKNASSVFSITVDLTPKTPDSQLEIWDRHDARPCSDNDRYMADTFASLVENHKASNVILYENTTLDMQCFLDNDTVKSRL